MSRSSARLDTLLDGIPNAVIGVAGGVVVEANGHALELFGYSREEMIGGLLERLIPDRFRGAHVRHRERYAAAPSGRPMGPGSEMIGQRADGTEFPAEVSLVPPPAGDSDIVTAIVVDITERRLAEDELQRQALHDPLTGLPNRRCFLETLDAWLAEGRSGAVLFLDLDRFGFVNDALGHAAGDELLAAVAGRLAEAAGRGTVVARLGGDEFAVLCDAAGDAAAEEVAARLVRALEPPVALGEISRSIGISIGIAMLDGSDVEADSMLRSADAAMYRAKGGGATVVVFDDEMRAAALRRIAIELDLAEALDQGELELAFQPIVALDDGRRLALEALARWTHPTLGDVGPDEFIPIAEESGQIVALGRWVLHAACAEAVSWPDDLRVTVNVLPSELTAPGFADDVRSALRTSGLDARRLTLETTETAVMCALDGALAACDELHTFGVSLSIDDFGTGWSSLTSLHSLPINELKIDRSFIERIEADWDAGVIVRSILGLAATLHLDVVAEGIETEVQAAMLRDWGCRLGQGYLYGRPAVTGRAGRPAYAAGQPRPPGRARRRRRIRSSR